MKRSPTRTVFIVMLVLASFGSYLFLNNVSATTDTYEVLESPLEYETELDELDNSGSLPDLMLIKKVIEAGKQLIPAN
jgi:regulatory protein YycI of two-component signal transduction system YycFG